jgi:LOB domain-containing protein 18
MQPSGKRVGAELVAAGSAADAQSDDAAAGSGAPCGACKFLRRRCVRGCVFAPHFGGSGGREHASSGAGAAQFAAVHKVFGASNLAKMLSRVPMALRRDTASTVCYEAQARVADPVYGCVGTILTLQHQVNNIPYDLVYTATPTTCA